MMKEKSVISIPACFYQQFDADYTLDVPAEGFSGWQKEDIAIDLSHTAVVVMHAWDCGTNDQYPGWYRHVEYIPRAQYISSNIFPDLLKSVRSSPMQLFHVVGSGAYYKQYSGYKKAKKLAGKSKFKYPSIKKDASRRVLDRFRSDNASSGMHNRQDIQKGFKSLDFSPEAMPVGDEGIAENHEQLFALCKEHEISHIIYVGFAINWCLLFSPGGMADMSKYGIMCSTIRQAVTAVENDFTAKNEICKEIALWRVSLAFGFVFDLKDVLSSLSK
jgi:hypothetical protein